MARQFRKHYTREQARSMLPEIRHWLGRVVSLRGELQEQEEQLEQLMEGGRDLGGPMVNAWVRTMSELRGILLEFHLREIQIKDLDRGLIDFPSLREGKEVFLCWEQGEEDIEFWHD